VSTGKIGTEDDLRVAGRRLTGLDRAEHEEALTQMVPAVPEPPLKWPEYVQRAPLNIPERNKWKVPWFGPVL